ncbi:MAG: sigma 54-interacting transcriptional regulator [Bacillota bacterium]|nr:sigma 54-interacting transcriptional regulator [Bacillota bacterium]
MAKVTRIPNFWDNLGPLGRAILDSSPEGILISDDQGYILFTNEAYYKIIQCNGQKRIGTNIFGTNPNGALAEALSTGKPVYGKKHRPPGSRTDVLAHAYPVYLNGKLSFGVVFFHELTDALEILEQIARFQESFRILSSKIESIGQAPYTFSSIVGQSESLIQALTIAKKVALTDSTVLLRGESGTGKELFAAAIHNASYRFKRPYIHVNCAAIPDNLLESEFFGYEKGSFTGANQQKIGTFELANEGTLFLDEIGDMDIKLQSKLLQVLQSGQFRRIGATTNTKVNVRVIAATNQKLEQLIEEGKFRQDLYYRLNVVEFLIPPLRDRTEDIPLLVEHFLKKSENIAGKNIKKISDINLNKFQNYSWPGNVRELENVLERMITLSEENVLLSDIQTDLSNIPSLEEMERVMIKKALKKFGNTLNGKKQAAKALEISLTTLYNKLKKMNQNL